MPLPFSDSINHDFALNRRRQIAVRIDEVFGDHPDVTAVFVFGSVAYGHPDGSSDIDVGVVCHPDVLTRLQRRGLLWQVSPEWKFDYFAESVPTQAIWDTYDKGLVDGITVEVHYMTVSKVSRVLDQVINKGAITTAVVPFRPYRLGSLLERAWVLQDKQGIFEHWRSQAAIYPPQLKQNILSHNIPILKDAVDELKISAERRLGPGVFLFFLFHSQHALDSILFALNDMYDPASRWDERFILPTLTIVPENFHSLYKYVLEGPFDELGALERGHKFEALAAGILEMAEAAMDDPRLQAP